MGKKILSRFEKTFEASNRCCRYCGYTNRVSLTLEHLVPIVRGGTNAEDNLGISCKKCNNNKGPLTEREFLLLKNHHINPRNLVKYFSQRIDPFQGMSIEEIQLLDYSKADLAEWRQSMLSQLEIMSDEEIIRLALSEPATIIRHKPLTSRIPGLDSWEDYEKLLDMEAASLATQRRFEKRIQEKGYEI